MMRGRRSAVPPGGNGTTIVTGRDGKVSPWTGTGRQGTSASAAVRNPAESFMSSVEAHVRRLGDLAPLDGLGRDEAREILRRAGRRLRADRGELVLDLPR